MDRKEIIQQLESEADLLDAKVIKLRSIIRDLKDFNSDVKITGMHFESEVKRKTGRPKGSKNSNDSETECPDCKSHNVRKAGWRRNKRGDVQKFACYDCGAKFSDRNADFRMKHSKDKINEVLDAYDERIKNKQSASARELSKKFTEISHATISGWLNKYRPDSYKKEIILPPIKKAKPEKLLVGLDQEVTQEQIDFITKHYNIPVYEIESRIIENFGKGVKAKNIRRILSNAGFKAKPEIRTQVPVKRKARAIEREEEFDEMSELEIEDMDE